MTVLTHQQILTIASESESHPDYEVHLVEVEGAVFLNLYKDEQNFICNTELLPDGTYL